MSVIRQWGPKPLTPKQKLVLMFRIVFFLKYTSLPIVAFSVALYISLSFSLDCKQCTLSFDVYHMGDYRKVIRGPLWKHSQWLYLPLSLFKGALNIYASWSTSLFTSVALPDLPQLWAMICQLAASQNPTRYRKDHQEMSLLFLLLLDMDCMFFSLHPGTKCQVTELSDRINVPVDSVDASSYC